MAARFLGAKLNVWLIRSIKLYWTRSLLGMKAFAESASRLWVPHGTDPAKSPPKKGVS